MFLIDGLNNPLSNNQRKVNIDEFVLSYLNTFFLEKKADLIWIAMALTHIAIIKKDSSKPSKYVLSAIQHIETILNIKNWITSKIYTSFDRVKYFFIHTLHWYRTISQIKTLFIADIWYVLNKIVYCLLHLNKWQARKVCTTNTGRTSQYLLVRITMVYQNYKIKSEYILRQKYDYEK